MNGSILKRIETSQKLYKFNDHVTYTYSYTDDNSLASQVIDFFLFGSEPIYPAKFIYCNIVYAYYLSKYFNCSFYECLDCKDIMPNSPYYLMYSECSHVYEQVIQFLGCGIEEYDISKTRKYFKLDYLIFDESLAEVLC